MKDPSNIARQGSNAFSVMMTQMVASPLAKDFIYVAMVLANYVGGACILTGFSRAVFAFARDGGLPHGIRKVSTSHKTPAMAIWVCAIVGFAVTLYSSAFNALVAGVALFYQLSYSMPILAALFSRHRTYGPYRLGIMSKPLGIIAIAGGALVVWVGLQPPTQILVNYFAGIGLLLLVGWFANEKRRFQGPPALATADKATTTG
jgi:amino acid transporter